MWCLPSLPPSNKVRYARELGFYCIDWNERNPEYFSDDDDDRAEGVPVPPTSNRREPDTAAETTVLRVPDKHLDIDSEFRSGKGKFKNWHDVVKIANEVHLDEMKALLETGPQFLLVRSRSQVLLVWRGVVECF